MTTLTSLTFPPGDFLKDAFEERELSQTEFVKMIDKDA